MKKTTLLHPKLSRVISELGHTDAVTICDAGLPIAAQCERIDLALSPNIPTLMQVAHALGTEMFVEKAIIASEIQTHNPSVHQALCQWLMHIEQSQGKSIMVDYVSHENFKRLTHQSKAVVRSGECSPYANIILYSGVPF